MEKTISDREYKRKVLEPYVTSIWSLDSQQLNNSTFRVPYFADGMPGLMFQQGDAPMYLNDKKKLASLFLYGQTIQPVVLSSNGSCRMIVMSFYPDVVPSLFDLPANLLTETCVDFSLLPIDRQYSLTKRLLDIEDGQQRIRIIEDFIIQLILDKGLSPDREIREVTSRIQSVNGNVRVSELAKHIKFSEKTLTRRFEHHIGVNPKRFSSISRFRTALTLLEKRHFDSFSGLAFDLGYSDQSHFIREFKNFSGLTPRDFVMSHNHSS